MLRKGFCIFILIGLASLLAIAAAPGYKFLTRLTVRNRTDQKVYIQLYSVDKKTFYYLRTKPGTTVYTVERKIYNATFWGCKAKKKMKVDMSTQLRVTFPPCNSNPRPGEPRMMKVIFQRK